MLQKILVLIVLILMISSGTIFLSSIDSHRGSVAIPSEVPGSKSNLNNSRGVAWRNVELPDSLIQVNNSQVAGQSGPFTVNQIRSAYNLTPFYNKDICGQGYTITIVDAYGDPALAYDISSFDSLYSLPNANISYYYPYGSPKSTNSSWSLETATDVEWFHSIAPKAHIDLVIVPNADVGYLQGGVNYTVNNISNINGISMSWGIPESSLTGGLIHSYNGAFKLAEEKNIHVFAASGDQGAYDDTKGLTVNFPATDPYITAVGGTSLSVSNGEYSQTGWSGSGGGYSTYFNAPSYQRAPGFHSGERGVPDISAIANPNSGGVIVLSRGGRYVLGGTSLATPIVAASFMLIDQSLKGKLGFVNSILYNISRTNQYSRSIIPVDSGNNGFYSATNNWNPVTGLGYINAERLACNIERINSYYGYSISYGFINTSSFSFCSNVSLTLLGSPSGSFRSFAGLSVGYGSSIIEAGLCQAGNRVFERMKAGNYQFNKSITTGSGVRKLVVISFKTQNLTLKVGNTSNSIQVFPEDLLGSNASTIFKISTGIGIPQNGGSSFFSGTKLKDAYNTNLNPLSGSSIFPFNRTMCSIIKISNESNGISMAFNSTFPSGSFGNTQYGFPRILMTPTDPVRIYFIDNANSIVTINNIETTRNNATTSSGQTIHIKIVHGTETYMFRILVPSFSMEPINFTFPSSTYFMGNFTSTLDYTSSLLLHNRANIPTIGTQSNLSTSAFGFYDRSYKFNNQKADLIQEEIPVNLSFDISPTSSKLKLSNGTMIMDKHGINIYSVIPQRLNFSISYVNGNYMSRSGSFSVNPGENVTYLPVSLVGKGRGYFLNGSVCNGYYNPKYNMNVPIRYSNISYGNISAFTDAFGFYSLWLPAGVDKISTSAEFFFTNTQNYTENRNISNNVILLEPDSKALVNSVLSISIDRLVPLFFLTAFISWSASFSSSSVKYYEVEYKANGQSSWTAERVGSGSNGMAFLTGIYPGNVYKVKVVAVLDGGITVVSGVNTLSYNSPVYLLLNVLIYLGIALYVYSMISFFRRRKNRKKMKDAFREW
ncbi:MAG: S8 family serine peptidase [Cuniculiplasma sp.]